MSGINIAVVGATGAVGQVVLSILEERNFPVGDLRLLASKRSAGTRVSVLGQELEVGEAAPDSFDGTDIVFFAAGGSTSQTLAPEAAKRGAVVVDKSSAWRMDPAVPLVIPEINPDDIREHKGIISSPNCSTTQLVVAMKPLHDAVRITRVVVSTYQATSGAGQAGEKELEQGSRAALAGESYNPSAFAHPIAFNLIPQIGRPKHAGYTSEEMKMVWETQKIFGDDSIRICPTCVRAPVTNCHSESISIETERKVTVEEARELFAAFPGITVIDDLSAGQYPMPLDCSGKDDVFIGRIREDLSCDNGLVFWCVSDNLRKGAATNAVQIAELLASRQTVV